MGVIQLMEVVAHVHLLVLTPNQQMWSCMTCTQTTKKDCLLHHQPESHPLELKPQSRFLGLLITTRVCVQTVLMWDVYLVVLGCWFMINNVLQQNTNVLLGSTAQLRLWWSAVPMCPPPFLLALMTKFHRWMLHCTPLRWTKGYLDLLTLIDNRYPFISDFDMNLINLLINVETLWVWWLMRPTWLVLSS